VNKTLISDSKMLDLVDVFSTIISRHIKWLDRSTHPGQCSLAVSYCFYTLNTSYVLLNVW